MITSIVTVHGTFANHEDDEGEKWWQKNSTFQKEVAARIDTSADDIDWVPFHWSGKNSEADRRSGGLALFVFLQENFENKNQPYHLVGHSHGGSVIAEALRWSTRRKSKLENMQSWITVATPFLAFKRQSRLLSRLKRRYQLLFAVTIAYVLAVLLAVPIGVCSKDDMAGRECWVEKSNEKYFDFDAIKTVHADLSHKESVQLPHLGSPSFLEIATDAKSRGENGKMVQDIFTRPVIRNIKLNMFRQAREGTFNSNESIVIEFPAIDANFTKPEYWPPGIANRKNEDTYIAAKGEKLAIDFRQFAQLKHDASGKFPLDMCAPSNLEFFSFVDTTDNLPNNSRPINVTPETGSEPFPVTTTPEFWEGDVPITGYVFEIYSEKFAYNKTIYWHDLQKFIDYCATARNRQESESSLAVWGGSIGFKEPKTLTFLANYEKGKKRLLRLHFQTMGEMKITPFISRSEALKSLGFLMYLAFSFIPVWIAVFLLWKSQKFLRKRYKDQDDDRFTNWYKSSWLKLAHPEDEAINAISASTKVKVNMAPADLLQGIFMLAFSILMAVVLIFRGVSLINFLPGGKSLGFERELIAELGYAINRSQDIFNGSASFTGTDLTGLRAGPLTVFFNNDESLSVLALLLILLVILIGFITLGRMFEKRVLNPMLKRGIDGIAQSSGISGAFGDDILGEDAKICLSHPLEFDDPFTGEFPETVQRAIEKYANEDLVNLPAKFRKALHKNVTSARDFDIADLLEGEMGEILLHTSYFNVKEFHDLFAAALVATGDYKASPEFKSRRRAATWIKGLKA